MVTLCFHSMERDIFDQNISHWTNLSALFAGFSMTPDTEKSRGVFADGKPKLTTRETEVLSLLATGLQTGRIAERLGLAEITVAKHFRSARQKLNAATREQSLIKAMRYELLKF
jgi:DNA-binding NarL/FixJ family response regulator